MSERYFTNISKLINNVIKAGKEKDKVSVNLEEFIKSFFKKHYIDDLDNQKIDFFNLYLRAKENFEFLQNRKDNELKIDIFTTKEDSIWSNNATIIRVSMNNIPFLLDSITAYLTDNNYKITYINNSVFSAKRDKNSNIENIWSEKKEGEVFENESLINFEINAILNEKQIEKITRDIHLVIGATKLSVNQWKAMVEKVEEVSGYYNGLISLPNFSKQQNIIKETKDFLDWIKDVNFVILGIAKFTVLDAGQYTEFNRISDKNENLGVFASDHELIAPLEFLAIDKKIEDAVNNPFFIDISKSKKRSLTHRNIHMDMIRVQTFDKNGKVEGEYRIYGLFTSVVYHQNPTNIPIVRKKLSYVLSRANFNPKDHDGKELLSILEDFPRDEIFQISEGSLFEMAMGILTLFGTPKVRLFSRADKFRRFVSNIIYYPRDSFSTDTRKSIQEILEKEFGGVVSAHYVQINTDSPLARLNVIIKTDPNDIREYDLQLIENKLVSVASLWKDHLYEILKDQNCSELYARYKEAFSLVYSSHFNAKAAHKDIKNIESLLGSNSKVKFDLYSEQKDENKILQLKIYNIDNQIFLSNIMPILDNFGLTVIDEHTYTIEPSSCDKKIIINYFRLTVRDSVGDSNIEENIKQLFEEAIEKVWNGEIADDIFNSLLVKAGLSWQEIIIIRTYSSYLKQIKFVYSPKYIGEALAKHPKITKNIIALFYGQFDTSIKDSERNTKKILDNLEVLLSQVSNITEDVIIRKYIELISNSLRTNYFQKTSDGKLKDYLSIKIDSQNLSGIPLPKPFVEIFVYSNDFEAIHLRGGKVARGGLRWSDRKEDFRTEVLGLVKAQMTKNAVIVPVGSKGGFVIKKDLSSLSREEYLKAGIRYYQNFLRGLLDITDNIKGDKIISPTNVVRRDGDDPYLVVAADKGTATFSDIANGISKEYDFWLDDAFASGGSQGYDHKKMGITAKGGWVSVVRHFSEMGVDISRERFSVVGIGDMSGDVFGNGMLRSDNIDLVAAFNHIHIFIDPNPIDNKKAFAERERLFNLPRSQWTDYDAKLISKGGGVFSRNEKFIDISNEIKERFEIEEDKLSPDNLIKYILKAKVDLLWNGGIGTYVKASFEKNDDAGDKANDGLRVNGKDLRCKIIGEGGNLGFTQNGRIEYALNGGRLNTDAIDNSAGVDCSDHEVNIKIALGQAVASKKLDLDRRNKILEDMTPDVEKLVLRDNFLQTQAISVEEEEANKLVHSQIRLINKLEKIGLLNREVEFLPSEDKMAARYHEGKGLSRPEIAVLLSYSKIYLYNQLIESSLPKEKYFDDDLLLYFPKYLQENFKDEILNHPLRKEIVATLVANSVVNRTGLTLYNNVSEDTGLKICDIARSYIITRDAFGLREVWAKIENLTGKIDNHLLLELEAESNLLVERSMNWFLRNLSQPLDVEEAVKKFKPFIAELYKILPSVLSPVAKESYQKKLDKYLAHSVPVDIASQIASMEIMSVACYIVNVAINNKLEVETVAGIYFNVGNKLHLRYLRDITNNIKADSHWDRLSIKTIIDSLFEEQMRITGLIVKDRIAKNITDKDWQMESWCNDNCKQIDRFDKLVHDIRSAENIDLPMLVVALSRVAEI